MDCKCAFDEYLLCVKRCTMSFTYIIIFLLHGCLIFTGLAISIACHSRVKGQKSYAEVLCSLISPLWYFLTRMFIIHLIQTENHIIKIANPMCTKLYHT